MNSIAHCLIWYLKPTMGNLYDEIMACRPAASVILAAPPIEPERFPCRRLYSQPAGPTALDPSIPSPALPLDGRIWRPVVDREEIQVIHAIDGRIAPGFVPLARECGLPLVTSFLGRDVSANLDDSRYVTALQLVFREGTVCRVVSDDMARG